MKSIAAWLHCWMVAVVALTGCQSGTGHTSNDLMAYPYAPTVVKLHSLSRLSTDSTGAVIAAELWIEFKDCNDQTSRATGSVTGKVMGGPGNSTSQTINLNDPAANFAAWDTALRMYRMRIPIGGATEKSPSGGVQVELVWQTPADCAVTIGGRLKAPG